MIAKNDRPALIVVRGGAGRFAASNQSRTHSEEHRDEGTRFPRGVRWGKDSFNAEGQCTLWVHSGDGRMRGEFKVDAEFADGEFLEMIEAWLDRRDPDVREVVAAKPRLVLS